MTSQKLVAVETVQQMADRLGLARRTLDDLIALGKRKCDEFPTGVGKDKERRAWYRRHHIRGKYQGKETIPGPTPPPAPPPKPAQQFGLDVELAALRRITAALRVRAEADPEDDDARERFVACVEQLRKVEQSNPDVGLATGELLRRADVDRALTEDGAQAAARVRRALTTAWRRSGVDAEQVPVTLRALDDIWQEECDLAFADIRSGKWMERIEK